MIDKESYFSSLSFLQAIDYTSTRGGVSVLTNKAETTVSSLIIQKASVEDGGVYSCQAGQIEPTSVKIHVLTGKNDSGITVCPGSICPRTVWGQSFLGFYTLEWISIVNFQHDFKILKQFSILNYIACLEAFKGHF